MQRTSKAVLDKYPSGWACDGQALSQVSIPLGGENGAGPYGAAGGRGRGRH